MSLDAISRKRALRGTSLARLPAQMASKKYSSYGTPKLLFRRLPVSEIIMTWFREKLKLPTSTMM